MKTYEDYEEEAELDLFSTSTTVLPPEQAKEGLRYNEGKPMMHLIPPEADEALAEVLTYGAKKYAERNWEKGMAYSKVLASLKRHLLAWEKGVNIDEESGIHHLKLLLTNAAFLVTYIERGIGTDDRPSVSNNRS